MEENEVMNQDIYFEEEQQDISVIETVDIIDVSDATTYTVDTLDAFPAVGEGNEHLRHSLMNEREIADQHPITAITGLREELDYIESLKTVYSDKRNQANYYLWKDENILQEDRVGYFVSACSDINEIELCKSNGDIFGVTVDSAGFVGAQSDIARDIRYGLVVSNGMVHVRCESTVGVGDYVISNDYGYAQKNNSGYKVVGRHQIDGVEYAEIALVTPIGRICELSDDVESVSQRIDEVDADIVSAMNIAQAAYNKAGEVGEISEEALKDALEALDKANGASDKTDGFEERLSNSNALAEEAKTIALLATTTATSIANAAAETSNTAFAGVNDLIKDLEPIASWGKIGEYITLDTWDDTGKDTDKVYYVTDTKLYYYYQNDEWVQVSELNRGASYMTTYMKDDVATKAEIETAESELKEHTSLIEKNAKGFNTLVASIDKYSVGEYSQSYGLTREQAKSILKVGMIYVPTKHNDSDSHSETFGDETEPQWFTPHNYYEWNGNDWIEYGNSVAFFSEEPTPSRVLKYWYIDSDEAPDGYEPYALYIWEDEQWTKVNILAGNANNRITSMINQTTNKIASDIVDAQGDIASHQQWLDTNSANIQDVVSWKSDVEDDVSNIATIKQTADAAGASVAMVASEICGEYATIDGTWSETDKDISKVYYTTEDKKYWYYKSGVWNSTYYPTEAGLKVNGSSIVTAINNGETSVRINGDNIILNGAITNDGGTFYISEDGHMTATGGKIGGWKIHTDYIGTDFGAVNTTFFLSQTGKKAYWDDTLTPVVDGNTTGPNWLMYFNGKFGVTEAGNLYARNADISGTITATGGYIGGWNLVNNIWDASLLYTKTTYGTGVSGAANNGFTSTAFPAFWAGYTGNYAHPYNAGANGEDWRSKTKFYVQHDGKLYATGADISGRIDTDNGLIGGWTITSDGIEKVAEEVHSGDDGMPTWATGNYIAIHSNGTILSADVTGHGSSIKEIVNNPSQADIYYETKISSGKLKISRFGADWSEGSVGEESFMEYDCYGMRFEIYIDTEDNNVVKARIKGT